jgi:aspartate carbamoyltransferase catalytic subunit
MSRSLLSLTDLSRDEFRSLFRRAEESAGDAIAMQGRLEGRVVAGLFWQDAPREEATLRMACARTGATYLGGEDLFPDFPSTDLLHAAEAAGAYADIVVVRHPLEGAARAVADRARVPVINAGDGAREDPFRALLTMRSLVARRGEDAPRAAALCGDLRSNRLAHSLAAGLPALGTTVLLVPAPGREMPDHLVELLARRRRHLPVRCEARSLRSVLDMVDTVALTPAAGYQQPLFDGVSGADEDDRRRVRAAADDLDALFVATTRNEDGSPDSRVPPPEGHPWMEDGGKVVLRPFGRAGAGGDTPPGGLRDEAAREIPLAAELLALLLAGVASHQEDPVGQDRGEETGSALGMACPNLRCVVRRHRRIEPRFHVVRRDPLILECSFCDVPVRPRFAGSRVEKVYHALDSAEVRKILPSNLVYFTMWAEAEELGFRAARGAGTRDGGGGASPP